MKEKNVNEYVVRCMKVGIYVRMHFYIFGCVRICENTWVYACVRGCVCECECVWAYTWVRKIERMKDDANSRNVCFCSKPDKGSFFPLWSTRTKKNSAVKAKFNLKVFVSKQQTKFFFQPWRRKWSISASMTLRIFFSPQSIGSSILKANGCHCNQLLFWSLSLPNQHILICVYLADTHIL